MQKYLVRFSLVLCSFVTIVCANATDGIMGQEKVTKLLTTAVPHDSGRKVMMHIIYV